MVRISNTFLVFTVDYFHDETTELLECLNPTYRREEARHLEPPLHLPIRITYLFPDSRYRSKAYLIFVLYRSFFFVSFPLNWRWSSPNILRRSLGFSESEKAFVLAAFIPLLSVYEIEFRLVRRI